MSFLKTISTLADHGCKVSTVKFADGSAHKVLLGSYALRSVRKEFPAQAMQEGKGRTIKIIATDSSVDRHGEVVVASGGDFTAYRRNPVVLFNHDPSLPIARCTEVRVSGDKVLATVEFPPAGTSELSDEVFALIKAGVLSAWSIGFNPIKSDALDPGQPKYGPKRYTAWELLEISAVATPCNRNAVTIERDVIGLGKASRSTTKRQRQATVRRVASAGTLTKRQRQVEALRAQVRGT